MDADTGVGRAIRGRRDEADGTKTIRKRESSGNVGGRLERRVKTVFVNKKASGLRLSALDLSGRKAKGLGRQKVGVGC